MLLDDLAMGNGLRFFLLAAELLDDSILKPPLHGGNVQSLVGPKMCSFRSGLADDCVLEMSGWRCVWQGPVRTSSRPKPTRTLARTW